MSEDDELNAMGAVAEALAPLEPNVALRVVRWAYERAKEKVLGGVGGSGGPPKSVPPLGDASGGSEETDKKQFADLPALYDAASPSTESERALVVGYWFQVVEKNDGFYSYSVNTRLKHMGYQIGNITRAFDSLMSESPRLVIQLGKGDTRQARKKLRLTTEGIRKVESMIQQRAGT